MSTRLFDSNSNVFVHDMSPLTATHAMDIDADDYLMAPETDHELRHSGSEQSVNWHRITNGYEICVHTCVEGGCISQKTETILWRKEGHAVRKHTNNVNVHPQCTQDCPGGCLIGTMKASHAGGRDATCREVATHTGMEEAEALFSNVNASSSGGHDTIDRKDHHSTTTANRRFNIIYIPDAAMRIISKEKAQNDLGFIPTSLSESEYKPLQHLTGSIHIISKSRSRPGGFKVIMQEWVRVFL